MPKKKIRRAITRKSSTTKKVAKRSWFSFHPLRTAALIIALGGLFFSITRANGGLLSYFGAEPVGINAVNYSALCQGDPRCLETYKVSTTQKTSIAAAEKIVRERERTRGNSTTQTQPAAPAPSPLSQPQVASMCQADPTCIAAYLVSTKANNMPIVEAEKIVRKLTPPVDIKETDVACCISVKNSSACDNNSGLYGSKIDYIGSVKAGTKCPAGLLNCRNYYTPRGVPQPNVSSCAYGRGGGGGTAWTPAATAQEACDNQNPGVATTAMSSCSASYVAAKSGWWRKGFLSSSKQTQCCTSVDAITKKAIDDCKSIGVNTTLLNRSTLNPNTVASMNMSGGTLRLETNTIESDGINGITCKVGKSTTCMDDLDKNFKDIHGQNISVNEESCPIVEATSNGYILKEGTCCPNR